ncbi:lysylphosphatidylglycerol synthase transmembrane domain-containing protein [Cryptosporangium phraense]|uniref:Flippase-like domain-containing protein n=1 Tax=Cryptosporangium phraense TaxID=2593070 RepID=A0A545AZZ2_9ACTN|nr:lysylphosphatidylglycerol synthase domain-containing protein [Cryptosporangium phraense]TQS46878.1 flippase-like domain-containing protein [Cryptosporangium phraense]
MTHRIRRALLLLAATALAVLACRHLGALGASWSVALHRLAGLGWGRLCALGVVWMLGLWVHTLVLTASLPGLTRRRALTLNLSGSAVSNVLPLGGVAGTAMNLGMVRGWGHSGRDFARFTIVSKASDVASKLLLPLVATGALLVLGPVRPGPLWLGISGLAAVLGGLLVAAMSGRLSALLSVVGFIERVAQRTGSRPLGWTAHAEAVFTGSGELVRRRWAALTGGMSGYLLLQGLLLWLCLAAVGLHVAPPVVFGGLVAERALTLLALTPGGAGLVEAGTVAVFAVLGVDPTAALAGVLLYRAFIFLAEIPVGGVATALWALGRRIRPA